MIKRGLGLAHQKGWVKLPREPRKVKPKRGTGSAAPPPRRPHPAIAQPSLFPEL